MGGIVVYLDTILVPLSLFLIVTYHAYLWHNFKNKPSLTTIGINSSRRKDWFLKIEKEGMGMLAVQTLRNKLMDTILSATISMTMLVALAALTNNTYQATQSPSIHSPLLGLQHGKVYALKFGSACVFLVLSFLCSSLGIAFLIDANFLINACGAHDDGMVMPSYTQWVLERGFLLAFIGNRVLCITFPLLLWMFGPFPVALSSLALVWVLYELDFGAKCVIKNND